ncbi:MAG: tetratricopeptide repeat protein [Fibrobacterota bacterium]
MNNIRTEKKKDTNYWELIHTLLDKALRQDANNIRGFISKYRIIIDFAIAPQQVQNVTQKLYLEAQETAQLRGLRFYHLSDWIIEIIDILTMVEEKRQILDKLKHLKGALDDIEVKIKDKQRGRYTYLREVLDLESEHGPQIKRVLLTLPRVDDVRYTAIYKNEKTASGTYFNVDQKKEFAGERIWVLKQDRKIEEMMREIEDRKQRLEARKFFESIAALLMDKLKIERAVDRLRKKLLDIGAEVERISASMLADTIRDNLNRVQQLFEREINISGGHSALFYNYDEEFVSVRKVYAALKQIFEFVPYIFDNKYLIHMGAPKILFIPGDGNSFYDYRENAFIVPLTPVNDLETSLTYGISSFIRHYDYSKSHIHEFNLLFGREYKLKEKKEITRFNSYLVKWFFSEYKGFKVFEKNVRDYFIKHFSPKKNDIFCPVELLKGLQTPQQENLFVKNIRVDVNLGNPSLENLWYISIFEYRKGRLRKSKNYLKKLITATSDYIFAYYNLGVICRELNEKKEAQEYFERFVQYGEPSWWTLLAKEYLDSRKPRKSETSKEIDQRSE